LRERVETSTGGINLALIAHLNLSGLPVAGENRPTTILEPSGQPGFAPLASGRKLHCRPLITLGNRDVSPPERLYFR
jgi:hypothetical protein